MGSIRIKLMSDLCVGNGESVGYGIDSDICADNYGFPYIPGKRILGCMRDAAIQLGKYGLSEATKENIDEIFGTADGQEGKLSIGNALIPGVESMHDYILFLKKQAGKRDYLIQQSTEDRVLRRYTTVRGQTKIASDGKAEKGSLRFIRVLNQYDPISGSPLEFVCPVNVSGLNEQQKKLVEKTCKSLRHIGLNRNRGLGNILVTADFDNENKNDAAAELLDESTSGSGQVMLRYQVEFDSPITIQEYMENGSQIKARTLIGIFSGIYLRKYGKADEIFEKLFLDGTVKWSALTPLVNGGISVPAPAMMMKLKNGGGKLINSFACEDKEWKKKKPKSLEGYYASVDEKSGKYYVAQPESETNYHNRINGQNGNDRESKGLYMQEALKQGLIYGGYVILSKELLQQVEELFSVRSIRLGRSKKAQYGSAKISNIIVSDYAPEKTQVEDGEPVFVILRSDLVLQENASIRTDNAYVRRIIAEETGLQDIRLEDMHDICRYHVLTGYHTMWHMQKPKIPAVMGGSVYCFTGKKGEYPSKIVIGEYQQEGLGLIELVPMRKLKEISDIEYGAISVKANSMNEEVKCDFENMLLLEAVYMELQEYPFRFKKKDDAKRDKDKYGDKDKEKILKYIPAGRLRQMLQDAKNITELWTMVESMKTSDVSSESKGKREKSLDLLKAFYGDNRNEIDFDRLIDDAGLLEEVKNNQMVYEKAKQHWKEPLFILLHMVHYQKGRR